MLWLGSSLMAFRPDDARAGGNLLAALIAWPLYRAVWKAIRKADKETTK